MQTSFSKPILFISCAFLFIACGNKKSSSTHISTTNVKTYETITAQPQTISKTLQLNGELMPYEKSSIISKVNGYIKKVSVDIGNQVHKGQTLAIIDAPEMAAQIAQAGSQVKLAMSKAEATKSNYNRLLSASSTPGAVAANELDLARSQMNADLQAYNVAVAVGNSYKTMGGYLIIKAPFGGVITSRGVNSGDYVDNSGKKLLFELQDLHVLRLQVPVPEAYVASVLKDDKITFMVSSFPGASFPAKLVRKSGAISSSTRSELWEFEVPNADKKLKSGMFAEIQLPLQRQQAGILLPNSAFVTTQERMFVIRVKNGKTEWVDVKKGFALQKETEVMGPIQSGDVIVKVATDEIKDGSSIEIK